MRKINVILDEKNKQKPRNVASWLSYYLLGSCLLFLADYRHVNMHHFISWFKHSWKHVNMQMQTLSLHTWPTSVSLFWEHDTKFYTANIKWILWITVSCKHSLTNKLKQLKRKQLDASPWLRDLTTVYAVHFSYDWNL